jgi:alkylation response protein AidB-like acyl-CoA dehydrogenase
MTIEEKDALDLFRAAERIAQNSVAPNAATWERERRIGWEALRGAAGEGLTGIQVPVSKGGLGLPFSIKAGVLEILAREDFGFAMSLANTHNVAEKLAHEAPPYIVSEYVPSLLAAESLGCTALTESGAGSDVGAMRTTATKAGQGWRLYGEKTWITNAAEAGVIVVYAQTEQGRGTGGIASFLVDARRPGFFRDPPIVLPGQHSTGSGGFRLDGYEARSEEMLAPPGKAFKGAMADINGARTYVAAMCCGMVDKALRVCTEYGRIRKTFGKPLNERQGWRWYLADASIDLSAARLLVGQASSRIDSGLDAQVDAAKAKIFATRMGERHIPALLQAMGAEGLREKYPLSRHLMGARMAGYVDGSTEMLLERVSSFLK